MPLPLRSSFAVLVCLSVFAVPLARAEEAADEEGLTAEEFLAFAEIGFRPGPLTGSLGDQAKVEVQEGWLFADAAGARKFLELTRNIPSGDEVGVILSPDDDWWVLFSFDAIGYVKDDDKDDLDAKAMLDSIKKGVAAANKIHTERGEPTLEVVGWEKAPHYDEASHNLEWAPKAKSSTGSEVVNYNTRILGRRGVMKIALIASPEVAKQVMPQFRSLLAGFAFEKGSDYASFVQGDRVAEYGLAALVAGGGLAVAAKSGLLQKFWKLIVVGFAAVASVIGRFFKGDRVKDENPPPVG